METKTATAIAMIAWVCSFLGRPVGDCSSEVNDGDGDRDSDADADADGDAELSEIDEVDIRNDDDEGSF